MDQPYTSVLSDEERAALRAQRAAVRKRKLRARRRKQLKQFLPIGALAVFLLILLTVLLIKRRKRYRSSYRRGRSRRNYRGSRR